ERKCRFLFGLGILVLVTVSFFLYGQQTESLVIKQTNETARMLVSDALKRDHERAVGSSNFEPIMEQLWGDLKPTTDDVPTHKTKVLAPYNPNDPEKQPADEYERTTLEKFLRSANSGTHAGSAQDKPHTFADGSPKWVKRVIPGKKEFQYIQAVLFK